MSHLLESLMHEASQVFLFPTLVVITVLFVYAFFLLGAFAKTIQGEIEKNLDTLLGAAHAKAATKGSSKAAPKKAAKNITSEKMNQLMLQRKDTSTRSEYRPLWLSPMASPNHLYSVPSQMHTPSNRLHLPQSAPLTHWPAPSTTKNRPMDVVTGRDDGAGTK